MSLYKDASLVMIPTAYKDGKLYSIRPVPEYGAELVTNGGFDNTNDWTIAGSNVAISGGKANFTNAVTNTEFLQQAIIAPTGVQYRIQFEVSNLAAGDSIKVRFPFQDTTINSNGLHTLYGVGTHADFLRITPNSSTGTFSIDNVSVKEVSNIGDFTFSRGSNLAATRVDVNGLIEKGRENLFTQSNNFSHSDWNVKAGTFTQGVADPDGGSNAWSWTALNTDPYLYQSGKSLNGVGTLSIWVKGVGSTIGKNFELRNASPPYKNVVLTGEWQRVEHFNNTASGTSVGFEYGNPAVAGDVVHIYQAQYEQGLVATDYIETGASTAQAGILEDLPRLDYSGGASCPALLLEPQRTNVIESSEYFDGSLWSATNITITNNDTTSPEGIDNASKIVLDSGSSSSCELRAQNNKSVTLGNDYTFSVFAKADEFDKIELDFSNSRMDDAYVVADLTEGTIISRGADNTSDSIEDYGDGWYRITLTGTAIATGTTALIFRLGANPTGDGSSGFHIYGAQFEEGSYPTSYIPTYGSAVTRSVDGTNSLAVTTDINQQDTSWTIFYEFEEDYGIYQDSIRVINDGSNKLNVYTRNTDGFRFYYRGLSKYITGSTGTKILARYDGSTLSEFHDGAEVSYTASQSGGSSYPFEIKLTPSHIVGIKQIVLFPTALTDSECIALTTL